MGANRCADAHRSADRSRCPDGEQRHRHGQRDGERRNGERSLVGQGAERNTAEPAAITLTIDLSGISGTGKSTRAKYVTNAREIALRRLTATDLVEVAFPFYVNGTNGFPSSRTGLARFSFAYDVNTGALTSASGSLTSP
jgi:hypothetical protein